MMSLPASMLPASTMTAVGAPETPRPARDAEERGHAGQCNGRNQRNHVADGRWGRPGEAQRFDVRQRRGVSWRRPLVPWRGEAAEQ